MNLKMPSFANPTILAPLAPVLAPAGWAALVALGLALIARVYWPGRGPALQGLYIRCRGGVANNADVERITNKLDSWMCMR